MSLTNAQNALLTKKSDIPFFADLSNDEVLTVATDVNFLRLDKNAMIFEQGDTSMAIYYVVRGSVEILIDRIDEESGETAHIPVASLPRRSFFGEMAFITGEPRSARAVAAEDDTAVLTFNILNDVDSGDLQTIRALALVYYYFAQDLAGKLKVTSANYAKIKTVEDVPYDDLVAMIRREEESVREAGTNANVLTLDEALTGSISALFPAGYDLSAQREIIKTAISEAFGLNEKDLIIFAKNRIVIRLFAPVELPASAPEEATPSLQSAIGDEEAIAYLEELFSSRALFEKDVLLCEDAAMQQTVAQTAFKELLTRLPQRRFLSFEAMESYSHFRLAKAVEGLERFFQGAALLYLSRDCGLEKPQAEVVMAQENSRAFLRNLALAYVKEHRRTLLQMIGDSFMAVLLQASGPMEIPPVINEALAGTFEYVPLFSRPGGGMIASKADQIKMRLTQAQKEQQKRLIELEQEVERTHKALLNHQKDLEAMGYARLFSAQKASRFTHEQLRDIVVNEAGEFNDQKRLMQFIPAGAATLALKETADRGIRSARNDVARSEFKRAYKFFDKIHSNNTPKVLARLHEEIQEQIPRLEASYDRAKEELEEARQERLEQFDDGLSRIFEALMVNLGRKSNKGEP